MINFEVNRRIVILDYQPERNDAAWVSRELAAFNEVIVSRGFTFSDEYLIEGPLEQPEDENSEPLFRFRFAKR